MEPIEKNSGLNFLCKILLLEKFFPLLFRKNDQENLKQVKKFGSINSKEKKCCDCATD